MQIVLWLSEPYKIGRVSCRRDGVSKRTSMIDVSWKKKNTGDARGRNEQHQCKADLCPSIQSHVNLVAAGLLPIPSVWGPSHVSPPGSPSSLQQPIFSSFFSDAVPGECLIA